MPGTVNNIIDTSAAQNYTSAKKEKSGDLDKDAFLQLLVTQMRYQDPMNPTDNTEYMSQLAQYSSLEATMNISDTLDKGNALGLVGQYVIMNSVDSAGNNNPISGLVEYATVKDGQVLLSINDKYYPAEDLDSVVDYDYFLFLQQQLKDAANDETDTSTSDDTANEDDAAEE